MNLVQQPGSVKPEEGYLSEVAGPPSLGVEAAGIFHRYWNSGGLRAGSGPPQAPL